MKHNPNELTIENSAGPHRSPAGRRLRVHSIDQGVLVNNVAGLARAAKVLGVPTVLSTIGARGAFSSTPSSRRSATCSPTSRRSIAHRRMPGPTRTSRRGRRDRPHEADHGRHRDRGLSRPVGARCPQGRVRGLLRQRLLGDVTKEAHDDAKVRMTQAGAKPINWLAVTGEWSPDYTSPERAVTTPVLTCSTAAA